MANSNTVEIKFETSGGRRTIADSEAVGASVKGIGSNASSAASGAGLLNSNLMTMGSAAVLSGILALAAASSRIIGDLYAVNVEYGKLNAQLITITGSQAGADAVFARLEDFATKTPFQLNEVVNAFAKLKARGLDPSQEALTAYGDMASGMSKSLDQMIEAVADASTGEFERLRDFGVVAKTEGDKVSFTFKGITTTVAKEASAIEGYLVKLGQTNFGGGMNRQMEALGGSASNLEDAWAKLMRTIGEAGATDAAQGSISLLTQSLDGYAIMIQYVNDEVRMAAEWTAAYGLGQISFWEYTVAGADEMREKLRQLKDEMDNFDRTGMMSSHNSAESPERVAKLIAQYEKEEEARQQVIKAAREKAQKEDAAIQDAMEIDAISSRVLAWVEGQAQFRDVQREEAAAYREEYFAALSIDREMELADISARVQAYVDGEAQRISTIEKSTQYEKSLRQDVLLNSVALLRTLGVNQKAAAIAGIAINKGIALSAAYTSTAAGATLAFSSQLVPGDPTSLARAAAASAFTWKMGALNMALITASGFAEAANASGGGNPAGGGYSGGMSNSSVALPPVTEEKQAAPEKRVQVYMYGYTNAADPDALGRELAASIRKATLDGY